MDFNRFGQNRPANRSTTVPAGPAVAKAAAASPAAAAQPAAGDPFRQSRAYRWSFLALLVSTTLLVVATIFFIVYGRTINREAHYIKANQYQAVFVNVNGTNGGQVYFGHIQDMTSQFIRLTDVFYIQNQSSQQGQSNGSYNLVKLGCELHGPDDEMLINRSQVFFWENLKASSQVAQKAAEFHKQNPNGQKCSDAGGSTQQSNATTQTPATGAGDATSGTSSSTGSTSNASGNTPAQQPATSAPSTGTAPAKKQ